MRVASGCSDSYTCNYRNVQGDNEERDFALLRRSITRKGSEEMSEIRARQRFVTTKSLLRFDLYMTPVALVKYADNRSTGGSKAVVCSLTSSARRAKGLPRITC